ncbi:MAG: LamG-like jellyroll fold domain-containing protein [Planctomycetota bacterium]
MNARSVEPAQASEPLPGISDLIRPYQEDGPKLIFWNRFETQENVENSERGPGLVQTTYKHGLWEEAEIAPAYFGNGLHVNHDLSEGWANDGANFFALDLQNIELTPDQGTIEFWFVYHTGSRIKNYAPFFRTADELVAHYTDPPSEENYRLQLAWNGWCGPNRKQFEAGIDPRLPVALAETAPGSAGPGGELEFFRGDFDHFALVWDADGIDETPDTLRLYINGEVEASTDTMWDPMIPFQRYLYLGTTPAEDPRESWYNAMQGVIDNLKIWDAALINFDHRFDEMYTGGTPSLILDNPGPECYGIGQNQLVVDINMVDQPYRIEGGQFSIDFNPAMLQFVSIEPGDPPFINEIYEFVDAGPGHIEYAVGADMISGGTKLDTTMARITFNILGELCEPMGELVKFGPGILPTRLTRVEGQEVLPALVDLEPVRFDFTAPVFETFPENVDLSADAGGCTLTLSAEEIGVPTASDNCDAEPIISWERIDGATTIDDPFESGTTVITWTAADTCGNKVIRNQSVEVAPVNDLRLRAQLAGPVETSAFTRCIRLDLFEPGCSGDVEMSAEVEFTSCSCDALVKVPCGLYDCLTATDTLHLLRRTDDDGDFAIVTGGFREADYYVSDFTDAGTTDDSFLGGNFFNDHFIDILDYGVFIGEYGRNYGSGSTYCDTPWPNADANSDGIVDERDYFDFIKPNFAIFEDPGCCTDPSGATPVTSITVEELNNRGLGHLAVADLNNDGIVNDADMEAFELGVRP